MSIALCPLPFALWLHLLRSVYCKSGSPKKISGTSGVIVSEMFCVMLFQVIRLIEKVA